MAGLAEIKRRQEQWAAEGKTEGGDFKDLYINDGDLVFCNFIGDGEDGDPYFEVFYAHEHPSTVPGQFAVLKFCPVDTGMDVNYDCPGCRDDIRTKKRMAMWLWVSVILRKTVKDPTSATQVVFNGKTYFQQDINGPKYWNTSAWRESPLSDILWIGESLGSPEHPRLTAGTMELSASGLQRDKRFKIRLLPNSAGIDPNAQAQARKECAPVRDMLFDSIKQSATATAPTTTFAPPTAASPTPLFPGAPAPVGLPPAAVTAATFVPPAAAPVAVAQSAPAVTEPQPYVPPTVQAPAAEVPAPVAATAPAARAAVAKNLF